MLVTNCAISRNDAETVRYTKRNHNYLTRPPGAADPIVNDLTRSHLDAPYLLRMTGCPIFDVVT